MPAKRKQTAPEPKPAKGAKGKAPAKPKAAPARKRSIRELRAGNGKPDAAKRKKTAQPSNAKPKAKRSAVETAAENEREFKQEYGHHDEEEDFDYDSESDSDSDSGSESETDGINLVKQNQDAPSDEDEEGDDNGEGDDDLNVTFEFNDMNEKYYHGLSSLVETAFPSDVAPQITEAIISHLAVGTLVSCEDSTDVFAFGTAMPLDDGPLHKFMRNVLSRVPDFELDLSKYALLASARFVNLPPPLIPLLFDNVVKDIKWAREQNPPKFTKNKFIYIAPCKREPGAPSAGDVALSSLQFDRFEDELLCQESDRWVFVADCFRRSMSTEFPSIVIAELSKRSLETAMQQISEMCAV